MPHQALHQGYRHLGLGVQRSGFRARCGGRQRGRHPTKEALAAVVLLRENFPDLKVRFINVVDLYKLTPASEHRTACRKRF